MADTFQRYFVYLITAFACAGILFNLFQIIIIIAGGYNRNPNIESPLLQTLDAIALTAVWLFISIAIVFGSIQLLKKQKTKR